MPKNRKPKKREKTELNLKHFTICVKCGKAYAVIHSAYCVACIRSMMHKEGTVSKAWSKKNSLNSWR